jgi:hypothetical protein
MILAAQCATVALMNTNGLVNKTNKRDQAKEEFAKLIENVCGRGFHGTASVSVTVQDGHIQYTRVNVERMVK